MKISILSNNNLEPIREFLKEKKFEVYISPFNNIVEELLNNSSRLYSFDPSYLFVHFDLNYFLKDKNKLKFNFLKKEINKILTGLSFFLKKKNVKIILSSFVVQPNNIYKYLSLEDENYLNTCINNLNKKIFNFALENDDIKILNLTELAFLNGYKNIFENKFIYLGKIPFNRNGFQILSNELAKLTRKKKIDAKKKVLVVDLDNTLWGGILGEDKQIQLGQDNIGLIYSEFQSSLKYLVKKGIILAICSKNNFEDVFNEFKNNKNFKINFSDFIVKKINWKKKSENIIEIANELNLGLNSIVFLDDSKFEREEVKRNLKEVTVPEFPDDIEEMNEWFNEEVVFKYFYKKKITEEDKKKKKQYKSNQRRNIIKNKLSYQNFLKHLKINIKVEKNNFSQINRISQLTQKVNQFNLRSKRYTEKDIKIFMKDKNYQIYTLTYEDIYNHEGITGLAIIKKIKKNVFDIDTFLLSCRILGREVEIKFLKKILKNYNKNDKIYGQIIYTNKNIVCRDFYKNLNFKIIKNQKKFMSYSQIISKIKYYV